MKKKRNSSDLNNDKTFYQPKLFNTIHGEYRELNF